MDPKEIERLRAALAAAESMKLTPEQEAEALRRFNAKSGGAFVVRNGKQVPLSTCVTPKSTTACQRATEAEQRRTAGTKRKDKRIVAWKGDTQPAAEVKPTRQQPLPVAADNGVQKYGVEALREKARKEAYQREIVSKLKVPQWGERSAGNIKLSNKPG